ncbi:MAG: hypothetical protein IPN46_09375 [Saprospiraceae bacterium]|nr:hypothetical protein [Saprospiraceae bacterium]
MKVSSLPEARMTLYPSLVIFYYVYTGVFGKSDSHVDASNGLRPFIRASVPSKSQMMALESDGS